jgi:hypothetical protein
MKWIFKNNPLHYKLGLLQIICFIFYFENMVHTSWEAMLCTNEFDILWWWKSFCVCSFCRTDIVNEVNYTDLYIWNKGLQILSKYIKRPVIKFHHPYSSGGALFKVFSNIYIYIYIRHTTVYCQTLHLDLPELPSCHL